MKNFLHEWLMRRRIGRILAYNKKHPEQCLNLGDFVQREGIRLGQLPLNEEFFYSLLRKLKAEYGGESHV